MPLRDDASACAHAARALALGRYSHFAEVNPPSNASGHLLHNSTELSVCCGVDCFRWTGLVCAGACAVGACLSLLLSWRMRSWYQGRPKPKV